MFQGAQDIALSSKWEELGPFPLELDHRFEFLTMLPGMEVFIAVLEIAMNLKFLEGRGMSHSSRPVLWPWRGAGGDIKVVLDMFVE